jgi:hypothetical protein
MTGREETGMLKQLTKQKLSTKGFFDKYAGLFRREFTTGEPVLGLALGGSSAGIATPPEGHSHPAALQEWAGTSVPFLAAINYLDAAGFNPILKAAQTENHPEAFKEILGILIHFLGAEAPKGVFTPKAKPRKPVGRPISLEGARIYSTWVELGKPSTMSLLAKAFYKGLYTKANGPERRRLRNKCGRAVERNLDRQITQLGKQLVEKDEVIAELLDRRANLQ